jgi:hypothetical protein
VDLGVQVHQGAFKIAGAMLVGYRRLFEQLIAAADDGETPK